MFRSILVTVIQAELANSFIVHAILTVTGMMVLSGAGTSTIEADPIKSFYPGELVQATVTSAVTTDPTAPILP